MKNYPFLFVSYDMLHGELHLSQVTQTLIKRKRTTNLVLELCGRNLKLVFLKEGP